LSSSFPQGFGEKRIFETTTYRFYRVNLCDIDFSPFEKINSTDAAWGYSCGADFVESQVADSRPHTARMVAAAFGQKKGPTRCIWTNLGNICQWLEAGHNTNSLLGKGEKRVEIQI